MIDYEAIRIARQSLSSEAHRHATLPDRGYASGMVAARCMQAGTAIDVALTSLYAYAGDDRAGELLQDKPHKGEQA